MAPVGQRLAVDCSVVVKWKLTGETHATEADELLLDWQHLAVDVCGPHLLQTEVVSALLRAFRRGRVSEPDVTLYIGDLLALPFVHLDLTPSTGLRAFEIARQYNQGAFDCTYVALAEREGLELWTGDQRLYNALHRQFPFLRWIGDYLRKRP